MDVDAAGNWSKRESALDYVLEFTDNGTNWLAGVPIVSFVKGWNATATSEDYVVRWKSPVDAIELRIRAIFTGTNGHDGNTQIDAVIVSNFVPEPSSAALLLIAAAAAGLSRRTRKLHMPAPFV
jgi:hypothetical protein